MRFKDGNELILIDDGTQELIIPRDLFLTWESAYSLPEGALVRSYVGDRHWISDGNNQSVATDISSEQLDGYIAKLGQYKAQMPVEPQPKSPDPATLPDWAQFRSRLSIHPAILRIVQTDPRNLFLSQQLIAALWQLGSNPSVLGDIAHLWGMMIAIAPLEPLEIEELQAIAIACRMPFSLDEVGRITPQH